MSHTNVGTGNYVAPADLKARGYTAVRIVSLPAAADYAESCHVHGLWVLAIVIPAQDAGYLLPTADVYQFDNERDLDQSPADYQREATFYQRTYPDKTWISCGMASGNPAWWRGVQTAGGLPGFSGFAVHPYAKTPDQAGKLLQQYQALTPALDCWVTEWARPQAEIPRMQKVLRERCVHDFWFCSDCGVPGFDEMPRLGQCT